jgi:hypothetical protein
LFFLFSKTRNKITENSRKGKRKEKKIRREKKNSRKIKKRKRNQRTSIKNVIFTETLYIWVVASLFRKSPFISRVHELRVYFRNRRLILEFVKIFKLISNGDIYHSTERMTCEDRLRKNSGLFRNTFKFRNSIV